MSTIRFCFVLAAVALVQPLVSAADWNLLFLGDQRSHQPATRFEILRPILAQRGIAITYTEDVGCLDAETLGQYDGLMLYANIDTITADQATALLDYVADGHGFVPIHCATYCFRNSPEVVALMGAQFKQHGTGEMTTQSSGARHPIVDGYETFTSWDETYVHHRHNQRDRVVLEYRAGDMQAGGNTREPWTWIRSHGKGRVFYTAWGHDHRTWGQTGFHDLVERGVRWACGEGELGIKPSPVMPAMKKLAGDMKPFQYTDVGSEIPNYPAGGKWGDQEKPLSLMQQPAPATESIKHIVTPEGMHVELFADESMLGGQMFGGKPIAMNWDAHGRLWICETVDYPNELDEAGGGRDRVRVIEDTDGDMVADRSTVFAQGLSIPTAIAFHRGGVVVQNGVETLYLKDTDGDGKADVREVLISNWNLIDTHGGVSNFRNGPDNWIWAMQGYNDSAPVIDGKEQPRFRMGFFRFKLSQEDTPRVEKLEFVRSTTNNTWGLGISEDGLIFGSTANRQPSFFMPIANRYYERVRGWAPERLEMICPTHLFDPITDKVRQVDHHGGYTAAAGHAIYTARNYPPAWWNRTAFVCGPTGKLVGTFVIERDGAGMKSASPLNLFASDDEWTAPIMAEVGPDGNVWVLDWYNYIVQHNPTPQGFETGKGRAYETKLRDKKYGRIYRVVPDRPLAPSQPIAQDASTGQWIAKLSSPTMQVRLSAQRLLVERGLTGDAEDAVIESALLELLADQTVDDVGLNVGAISALNTLDGLGLLDTDQGPVFDAVATALEHPSAGVRRNAVAVLPETDKTLDVISKAGMIGDPDGQVVLASLLKVADVQSASKPADLVLNRAIVSPRVAGDRWLTDAMTSAGAMHASDFLPSLLAGGAELSPQSLQVVQRIAEHFARSRPTGTQVSELVASMGSTGGNAVDAVIAGLSGGWPADHVVATDPGESGDLKTVFAAGNSTSKASLARLAVSWSDRSLETELVPIVNGLIGRIEDPSLDIGARLAAARELIVLDPARTPSADAICETIGPQTPTALSIGLIGELARMRVGDLGERLIEIHGRSTPEVRQSVVRAILLRPEWTESMMDAGGRGEIQVTDLTLSQRSSLRSHPSESIRRRFDALMTSGGVVTNNDRDKLVRQKMTLVSQTGDVARGKQVFTKNCAACHIFKGEGQIVGPNLNGMSVHPKAELLTHILDPNRSVEANYRLYTVLTGDGTVVSGLLSSESLTTIEMVDSQGKRQTILREDIERLQPSTKSAMPEGFEQSIDDGGLVDLLEYLTQADTFIPLGLESVANVNTNQGMFYARDSGGERLRLETWGVQAIGEVPFALIDPQGGTQINNAVMLHGPQGPYAVKLPKSVSVRCRTAADVIHVLGGIGGWARRSPGDGGVSMIVRLRYADGTSEDHPLVSGRHIADYNGRFDVPDSRFAMATLDGGQIRWLSIEPARTDVIDTIELVKPNHPSAPIVMAITVERPGGEKGHDALGH